MSSIQIPPLPERLPRRVESVVGDIRSDRRKRLLQAMYVAAATGYALSLDLRRELANSLTVVHDNASVKSAYDETLPALGLVERQVLPFVRGSRIALLRLTDKGQALCREMGWPVVENEWQRLIDHHRGDVLLTHTSGLLSFASQARRRGWRITLLPQVQAALEPDLLLEAADGLESLQIYAEFETRGHGKLRKWRKAAEFQGFVAIGTFIPSQRRRMIEECKEARVSGLASDLETLIQREHAGAPGPLWLERWQSRRDFYSGRKVPPPYMG